MFFCYSGGSYRRKRKRYIDYNEEIPFQKEPPLGFHDTSEDASDIIPHNFKRMRHQEVVGEKRDDIERVRLLLIVFTDTYLLPAYTVARTT